jgi:hypothetical protein
MEHGVQWHSAICSINPRKYSHIIIVLVLDLIVLLHIALVRDLVTRERAIVSAIWIDRGRCHDYRDERETDSEFTRQRETAKT